MPDHRRLDRRTTSITTGGTRLPTRSDVLGGGSAADAVAGPSLRHQDPHRQPNAPTRDHPTPAQPGPRLAGAGLPVAGPPVDGSSPTRPGPTRHAVRIGVLSTYPPTQCGLATFSAALVEHLARTSARVGVVRVVDEPLDDDAPEVVAQLVNGRPDSAAAAVGHLDGFDTVVVQHEYGIYGGPDGVDVVPLLEAVSVPVVVVLHTVLQDPSAAQRSIVERLLRTARVVVTMTETARTRLIRMYGADPAQLTVVPHGATVHRSPVGSGVESGAGTATARARPAGATGRRPLVLTWGLIGPGKGIEWAVDAMAGLRDLHPRYLVLGETHPKVLDRDGEAYRDSLVRRAADRGVADLVEFDATYLGVEELADVVAQADVVLLPYDSREQVTSGVLIEAVAAGRPVVSTAFPHAVELLTDGPGLVVPQRDPDALAGALRRVLSEPGLARDLSACAVRRAPGLLWGAVADRYLQIAETLSAPTLSAQTLSAAGTPSTAGTPPAATTGIITS